MNISGREAKKAFAQTQFEELTSMGLSRKAAGTVMRAAGPRLAVSVVEWVRSLWVYFCQEDLRVRACFADSKDKDDRNFAVGRSTQLELVNQVRIHLSRLTIENNCHARSDIQLTEEERKRQNQQVESAILHLFKDRVKAALGHNHPPQAPGTQPDEVGKIAKMADAALTVIPFLDLRVES